jgi:hypothetical protein
MSEESKATDAGSEEVQMSFSDIRRAISGDMDFTIVVNKDVEISFRELVTQDLNEINNELDARGLTQFRKFTPEETKKIESGELKVDYNSKDYDSALKTLKLTWAYKSMSVNGKKVQLIDKDKNIIVGEDKKRIYVEKLLLALGEGVIKGLSVQYENIVISKFLEVKKK